MGKFDVNWNLVIDTQQYHNVSFKIIDICTSMQGFQIL